MAKKYTKILQKKIIIPLIVIVACMIFLACWFRGTRQKPFRASEWKQCRRGEALDERYRMVSDLRKHLNAIDPKAIRVKEILGSPSRSIVTINDSGNEVTRSLIYRIGHKPRDLVGGQYYLLLEFDEDGEFNELSIRPE